MTSEQGGGERDAAGAVGPWRKRPFKEMPDVDTVSGEPANFLCSGTLLLRRDNGEFLIGWCESYDGGKEFFFYSDEVAGVAKDIEAWAQIGGEEA